MRQWAGVPVVIVAAALVLTGCGPKVTFWGDSELGFSSDKVVAAQSGPETSTQTFVYANPGCGLLPNAAATCSAGSTQSAVNAYWKHNIATDDAAGAPAFVQVELGINDAMWYSAAQLENYKTRVERFVSWLPAGVPCCGTTSRTWRHRSNPRLDQKLQIVNAELVAAAAETPRLHIVDVRTPFAGHYPEWWQSDLLHFNDAGQYTFALVNCQALDALSAALDPKGIGVAAPCDPNFRTELRPKTNE